MGERQHSSQNAASPPPIALALVRARPRVWRAAAFLREFHRSRSFVGVVPAFKRALALDPRNAEGRGFQYGWALLCGS